MNRSESLRLLHSSLAFLTLCATILIACAWFAMHRWHFSVGYPFKSALLFGICAVLILRSAPQLHPFATLGAANVTTLGRATLVCLLAGMLGEHVTVIPVLVVPIAVSIMLLDGLDGWLARRGGTASAFGARFDMETDALFVAALSALAWSLGKVGVWVLLSGGMRYLFAALAALIPLLGRPVPSSYRGKTIAVLQMLALIVVIAPECAAGTANVVAALALTLLAISFLLDVVYLLRQTERRAELV